jgi:acetyltransferase
VLLADDAASITSAVAMRIEQVDEASPPLLASLAELLIDSVHGGGCVGFLAPLAPDDAAHYWRQTLARRSACRVLWVARGEGGRVLGAVQLSMCERANGRHRAEVQKLMVLSRCRGQGLSSLLMAEVEDFARRQGRPLLVLGADAGSKAESVYRHLGWQRAGEIPGHSRSPDGELHGTAYFYKQLEAMA